MTTFLDLGVSRALVDTLERRDILAPFEIQSLVLRDALAGSDVLARSQTGSGKTLAFAIPIVQRLEPGDGRRPAALVLVPTRELAVQVADEFADIAAARGLRVGLAYGGVSVREQDKGVRRAHVLIATPGRCEDLATRKMVRLDGVRILVVDEADRMLDMGFHPQVDKIVRRLPTERQTMFFSATLDGAAGRLAQAYTRDPVRHETASEAKTVLEVDHRFIPVPASGKVDALVELLHKDRELALVFVRTKRGADRLVRKLLDRGVRAEAMHGDMTQKARERALARFDSHKVDVLVATDVAARGLDLERISHVINFDPPGDDKGYVHRVGRTARAGRSGTGVTLVAPDQQADVGRMAARLDLHEEFQEEGMKVVPPRVVYSRSPGGRRSGLRRRTARRF